MAGSVVKGAALVAFNLRQLSGPQLQKATELAVAGMGGVALAAVKRNVTRRDHTLDALAAMGHPYARRHGSIRVHAGETHVMHTHSGRLARSLKGKLVRRPGGRGGGAHWKYRIDFSNGPPRYVEHVIKGTRIMLGRDVLAASVYTPEVRKGMLRAAVTVFGAQMRTGAGLRFPSGG